MAGAYYDESLGVPTYKFDSGGMDSFGNARMGGGGMARRKNGGWSTFAGWGGRGGGGAPDMTGGGASGGYQGSRAGGLIIGNQMRRALGMPEWDYSGNKQQDLVQNTLADRMDVLHKRYGPSSINPNVMRDIEPKIPVQTPDVPAWAMSRPSWTSGTARNALDMVAPQGPGYPARNFEGGYSPTMIDHERPYY